MGTFTALGRRKPKQAGKQDEFHRLMDGRCADLDRAVQGAHSRPMSAKELALDVIKRLPDNATMHDLTEELYAAAVREGLAELDRGEAVPHSEVRRQFDSWFTK